MSDESRGEAEGEVFSFPLDFSHHPPDESWSFAHCKPSETTKWTHSYHRYPAKFIPQLVERLFDEYLPVGDASVNDPFLGSGTTIVSALARGYHASGTDINRIAFLMTSVKCTPIDPRHLESKLGDFLRTIAFLHPQSPQFSYDHLGVEPLIPEKHQARIDYWFREDDKIKLGQILRVISREEDDRIRRFLLLGFSNILKNCSIWMRDSTKPTRDPDKVPESPYLALKRQLCRMQKGNEAYCEIVPDRVKRDVGAYLTVIPGDARHQPASDESVDLVVTSSPYVTSYEYADLHQLSTIWLDLADDLAEYKKAFIGTAYKQYEDPALNSSIAKAIVAQMSSKSAAMAKEIEAFFTDMQSVIGESYRILREGGRACYVIGNTRLKGVNILNAEAFAEIMINSGFRLDRIIKREIPSKILPQTRDARTGRFARALEADNHAYPCELIVIGKKEGNR